MTGSEQRAWPDGTRLCLAERRLEKLPRRAVLPGTEDKALLEVIGGWFDPFRQFLKISVVWQYRSELLAGLWVTIQVTLISFAVSLLPSLLMAIARTYAPRIVRVPLSVFVVVVRSIPAVVGIVFLFFALPFVGITFSSFWAVVITLTVIQTVYFSEVFRGALLSVGKGQFEAGYSVGLSTVGVYSRVVLPQAFAVAAPSFASSVIQLVQNSTVASVVGLQDLLRSALTVQYITASPAVLLPAAGIYLLFLLPMVHFVRRMEERMQKARVH